MFDAVFDRHERIAFQFSGGKDSTAALFLLRDYVDRMTVYWLDSGDAFPETAALIASAVTELGIQRFVRIPGRVQETVAEFGPPADLVPFGSSDVAYAMGVGKTPMIQDRSFCCGRSKIVPMHQRMIDDGITLIVRGQKACDEFKGPYKSGDRAGDFEFLFPVEDWSDERVFAYLGETYPRALDLYRKLKKSGDCMRCSAWLGDQRGEYLMQRHPQAFQDYRDRIRMIAAAGAPAVENLFGALAAADGQKQEG